MFKSDHAHVKKKAEFVVVGADTDGHDFSEAFEGDVAEDWHDEKCLD